MKLFDKLFKRKTKDKIYNNMDKIKEELIEDTVKFTMSKINQDGNLIMTENTPEGFKAYPIIDKELAALLYTDYVSKFGIKGADKETITKYVEEFCGSDDLALALGKKYNEEYKEWEDEFYKDADDIEEEMWNFENEGKLKFKGYIEKAAEKADEYKGNINYDITPNLLYHEEKIIPYIEHDENPDEVVSLEDGSYELVETIDI